MDKTQRSTKGDRSSVFDEDPGILPVTCEDFFIVSHEGINYYLINLRKADWDSLWEIVSQCEYVESESWTPQEDFFDYLKRCDILCYAEYDGSLVGFVAASMFFSRRQCLYSNDETMVLKGYRNKKIALNMAILAFEWAFCSTRILRDSTHVAYTSISANPRVVNMYFKNAWMRIFFDCSFKPSLGLIAIKNEYCRRHGIELVNEDYPFCLKNLFPGSNTFRRDDPRFQFSKEVRASMPPEFEHMERGDAFAFMLNAGVRTVRRVVGFLMTIYFGMDYLRSRKIGPFRSRKGPAASRATWYRDKPAMMIARMGTVSPQNVNPRNESVLAPGNGGPAPQEME
jgi:hypothetical protein